MDTELTPPPIVNPAREKRRWPFMTLLACAACITVFVGITVTVTPGISGPVGSWDSLSKWGYYSAKGIRHGAIWAFLTSAFVHFQLWHVAFNVYWLYVLGSRLEQVLGPWRWLCFFLAAAFVSSGFEFAFSDSTGIGASGVVYALFGFMWVTRKKYPSFAKRLDNHTVGLFLIWLVFCWVSTLAKVWNVGNAAHFAGLVFGAAVGAWVLYVPYRPLITSGVAMLFLVPIVPLFWAPWSVDWTASHAISEYMKGDFTTAIQWYERSMSLGEDKVWCYQNIALSYHYLNDQTHYESTLQTLRTLDEKAARDIEIQLSKEKK